MSHHINPPRQGLYDPAHEHDACGVGFVVDLKAVRSHDLVEKAVRILLNLEHRGACGCEKNTGDGAGILLQVPHKLLLRECDKLGFKLPAPGHYGVGFVFLPRDPSDREYCERLFERLSLREGQRVLGWRTVPTDNRLLGPTAKSAEPVIRQVFIGRGEDVADEMAFERK